MLTGERVKNKFFSNGLELDLVRECPGFFKVSMYSFAGVEKCGGRDLMQWEANVGFSLAANLT